MSTTIAGKLEGLGRILLGRGKALLDGFLPPERRAELLARLKAFTVKHPKVMSFLLTNLALTGGPLALFVIFGVTVLVFSLIAALVVGLLAAVFFTIACVSVALLILFPVVFFTTLTACFLFLTALGGYYAFQWINKGDGSLPTAKGNALGDQINSLTGGRLDWVMDQVRDGKVEQALGPLQAEWRAPSARNAPINGHTPKKLDKRGDGKKKDSPLHDDNNDQEHESMGTSTGVDSAKKAVNVNNVTNGVSRHANTQQATKAINSATNAAGAGDVGKKVTDATSGVTGTVKGGLGGATGLA